LMKTKSGKHSKKPKGNLRGHATSTKSKKIQKKKEAP